MAKLKVPTLQLSVTLESKGICYQLGHWHLSLWLCVSDACPLGPILRGPLSTLNLPFLFLLPISCSSPSTPNLLLICPTLSLPRWEGKAIIGSSIPAPFSYFSAQIILECAAAKKSGGGHPLGLRPCLHLGLLNQILKNLLASQ